MKKKISLTILTLFSFTLLLNACSSKSDSLSEAKENEVPVVSFSEVSLPLDNPEQTLEVASPVKEKEDNTATDIAHPTTSYQMSLLDSELDLIEIESTFLQDRLKNEDLTTAQMNSVVSEWYTLWDNELNSLWTRYWDLADSATRDSKLLEQREWIKTKESISKEAAALYEGGSLYGIIKTQSQTKLTRTRCYEIACLLGELTGQSVKVPSVSYEGYYVDTQGTMEVYSDLTVTIAPDDFYEVEIGIYRLTTLTGFATLENGILKFTDEAMQSNIMGDIIIDGDFATFTVTASDWDLLNVGDIFTFNEKWN